jgi:hypothetical protein
VVVVVMMMMMMMMMMMTTTTTTTLHGMDAKVAKEGRWEKISSIILGGYVLKTNSSHIVISK